jgi:hypothetical protein
MKNCRVLLCSIWKNELHAALEWIAYHKLLGFEEIRIFDNNSTDGSRKLLERIAEAGEISHTIWDGDWPGSSPQVEAYREAARAARADGFDWIIYLDADEFLVPYQESNISDLIQAITKANEDVSAIAINWKTFGSDGQKEYSPDLVIDRFTRCADGFKSPNNCVKSIVRLERLLDPHIHLHKIDQGRYVNDAGIDGDFYGNGMSKNPSFTRCQVNHYMVKSYGEFHEKKSRGNANRNEADKDKYDRVNDEYFRRFDMNDVPDTKILRFRDSLLKELGRLKDI